MLTMCVLPLVENCLFAAVHIRHSFRSLMHNRLPAVAAVTAAVTAAVAVADPAM